MVEIYFINCNYVSLDSIKIVTVCPIDNKSHLGLAMIWCETGDTIFCTKMIEFLAYTSPGLNELKYLWGSRLLMGYLIGYWIDPLYFKLQYVPMVDIHQKPFY